MSVTVVIVCKRDWETNIYSSYLFYLLLYDVYFRSLDPEKN